MVMGEVGVTASIAGMFEISKPTQMPPDEGASKMI